MLIVHVCTKFRFLSTVGSLFTTTQPKSSEQLHTRWFKYDRDWLCVNKSQFVPVIFEPPCILQPPSFTYYKTVTCKNCIFFQGLLRAGRSADRIPVRGEIFRTRPFLPWGPPSFLYNGYRDSCPGVKRPGRGVNHPPPSSAEVKGRVELYLIPRLGLHVLF